MQRIKKNKRADTPQTSGRTSPARAGKLKLITISDLDGRTVAAKRVREVVNSLLGDLATVPSEAQRQLIQRASLLSTILESEETKLLSGEQVDLATYLSAVDRLRRVLMALGLERKARDVSTLTPLQYAKQQREARS
jgi:hypothetical protein